MISKKQVVFLVTVVLIVAYLFVPLKKQGVDPIKAKNAVIIDIWHPWGGDTRDEFVSVVEQFNAKHPGIIVHAVYSPNDMSNATKFFTSVAGGKPPDIALVDGPQVAAWADLGLLEPIDDFYAKAHLTEDDFWPPSWRQCEYKGHKWSVTYNADPNFAFVWNKKLFREAGLDPDKPPTTLTQLDDYSRRLTKQDPDGNITQLGDLPWSVYGGANTIFTWGWIFGGKFFDPATMKVTATNEQVLAGLSWLTERANVFGLNKVNAFAASTGMDNQEALFTGKVAMRCLHMTTVQQIPIYAPNLDWGIAPLPAPVGGEYGASWVGGWTLAVPRAPETYRTAERKAAARTFMQWACASDEGTTAVIKTMQLLSGYKRCAYFDTIRHAPTGSYEERYIRPYLTILETTRHQRPVMPAQPRYMFELDRALTRSIFRSVTPQQALADAQTATQQALDEVLKTERR